MKNKRILFFAPNFFGYDLEIKKKLEELGAIVDFYDDRPSNDANTKMLIRLNPQLAKKTIHSYFSKIVNENKDKKYDYVFFIKCEAALEEDLIKLHQTFLNAKFILYLYDSIKNIKFFDMKKKYFDSIYSFDLDDVKKDQDINFLPLFYLDIYKKEAKINSNYNYDVSFIGTAHSDRPKIINILRKELIKQNRSYYFQLYVPSKMILLTKKLLDSNFRELYKNSHITTQKINSTQVSNVMDDSRFVLDIQHPRQSGLTMRTIELLGMNKRFMTTNHHIKEYDFFNSNNVIVIDRHHPKLDVEILDKTYEPIPHDIYESYSIHQWIVRLFNL